MRITQDQTHADDATLGDRHHHARELDALERFSAVGLLFGVRREEEEPIHIDAGADLGREAATEGTLSLVNKRSEVYVRKHENRPPE